MKPHGWTLHEMLISMCVLGGVLSMLAHHASTQRRLFTGLQHSIDTREQLAQTAAIAERVLWGVSPPAGDILVAQDSALEVRMPVGAAAVCASSPGRLTIPAPTAALGHVLAAFSDTPQPGDQVAALFQDSLGATWLHLRVATAPIGDACARFPVAAAWTIGLLEPLVVPPGAAVRFSRRLRLSLYRASDAKWYLGAKEWNETLARFNSIQPVAGPLRGYNGNPSLSGLAFVYRDSYGAVLPEPVETHRIATITVVTRAQNRADSASVIVALRNAP